MFAEELNNFLLLRHNTTALHPNGLGNLKTVPQGPYQASIAEPLGTPISPYPLGICIPNIFSYQARVLLRTLLIVSAVLMSYLTFEP